MAFDCEPVSRWSARIRELEPPPETAHLVTGPCWHWLGEINRNGYGRVWLDGVRHMAHRLFYVLLVGDIPPGLIVDHLCRRRSCCNPLHLEPVTHQVNTLRGEAKLFQRKVA